MANKVPPQTIIASTDTDATTNYPEDFQNFPPLEGATCVNITVNNIEQRIQNTYNRPQGQQFEVQFKNCANFAGDSGLTYTLSNKTLNAENLNVCGISTLGDVACLRIDGGNPGDVLTKFTNNGDVVWCSPSSLVAGVNCVVPGPGIDVNSSTGAVTVCNTGVTCITTGTGITVDNNTGVVAICSQTVSVGTVDTSNTYTNVVSDISKLAFDTDSGFDVTDLGSGIAKVAMNSTFKYWEVDGNPGLTACGLDTVNFVAGSNVTITSDNTAVPKTLTISASAGGTPGGCNTQVQYNNAGTFTGASGLTYNNVTCSVGMTKIVPPEGQSLEITVGSENSYWYSLYGDFAGADTQDDYSSQVQYDSQGNVIIVGADGVNGVPFLVKYDPAGSIIWQINFTEINNYYKTGDALAVDSNDDIICSIGIDDAENDTTIIKVSSAGSIIWQVTLDTEYLACTDIVVDSADNIYAVCYRYTSGGETAVVVKLNSSGVIQWQIDISSGTPDIYPQAISLDNDGNIIITGRYGSNNNLYVVKLNNAGSLIWKKAFGSGSTSTFVGQTTTDSLNNIYVVGRWDSAGLILKLDLNGDIIWQRNVVLTGFPFAQPDFTGVVTDANDNIYVSGYGIALDDIGEGTSQLVSMKLDSSGNIIWQRAFAGDQNDYTYYYWAVKTIDIYDSSYVITGYTYTPSPSYNAEAVTLQMPTDGSLTGTYGDFKYVATNYTTNNTLIPILSETFVLSAGSLTTSTGPYTVATATNTNTLTSITPGLVTYSITGLGYFQTPNYTFPLYDGTSGQALSTDGSGTLGWQTFVPGLDQYCAWKVGNGLSNSTGVNNIAIGYNASLCSTFGNNNIAIGKNALMCNTTGCHNIAIGECALRNHTGWYGATNLAIGDKTLSSLTYGFDNIAIGNTYGGQPLKFLQTGSNNVAIGSYSLNNVLTGIHNVAIGHAILNGRQSSQYNLGIGNYMYSIPSDTGQYNTSIGHCVSIAGNCNLGIGTSIYNFANSSIAHYISIGTQIAGYSGTCSCHNIAIGHYSLNCYSFGSSYNFNIAIGHCTLNSVAGSNNIFMGNQAHGFSSYLTGCDNIGLGTCALYRAVTASNNIAIGCGAGSNIVTGSNNTIIGNLSATTGLSNTVLLGAGTCERVKVDGTGLYINGTCWCSGGGAVSAATPTSLGTVYARTTTAECNISVGYCSGNTTQTGTDNIAIGAASLFCNTAGSSNIAMGNGALYYNGTGVYNLAFGTFSLYCNSANRNVAVGPFSLRNNTTGDHNTAVGMVALCSNSGGTCNVAIGTQSLVINTTGSLNVGLGACAGCAITTGRNNTVIGSLPGTAGIVCTVLIGAGTCERIKVDNTGLYVNGACWCSGGSAVVNLDAYCSFKVGNGLASSTGINNFALGCNVLNSNTTGASNIAIGMCTMCAMTTGSFNIAIGCSTLRRNTAGLHNVALGYDALANNLVDGCNIAIGAQALTTHVSGVNNVAFGLRALGYGVSGSNNIAIGCASLLNNTTSNNIGIGLNSGCAITTGTNNTIIGSLTGTAGMVCTVLIGAGTCERIKVDNNGLCINGSLFTGGGVSSLNTLTGAVTLSGGTNVTIGSSGSTLTICSSGGSPSLDAYCSFKVGNGLASATGYNNFAIGCNTLVTNTAGCNNIGIGYDSLFCNNFGSDNIAFGYQASRRSICGQMNISIGCRALCCNISGCDNVAIGGLTLANSLANGNIAIGTWAMLCNSTGTNNVAVGKYALRLNTSGQCNVAVGDCALHNLCTGVTGNVGIGYCAGANIYYGSNNTVIGSLLGTNGMTCTVLIGAGTSQRLEINPKYTRFNVAAGNLECNNFGHGFRVLSSITTGTDNFGFGLCALRFISTASNNIAIGSCALYCNIANNNIALGPNALFNNTTGTGNIAIGTSSLPNNITGLNNIALGDSVMYCNTEGACNVAIGVTALAFNLTGQNNVAVGDSALINAGPGSLRNIGIGKLAGNCITTGICNTVIGSLPGTAGMVCTVLIGAGTCERIKVDDSGLCINGFLASPGDGLCACSLGYRIVPQNSQSTNYTLVADDNGKHILHPSTDANARTFTIPANSVVPYPIGTTVSFLNETSQAVTININSDTLYLIGTGATGSRTLAQWGMATIIKTAATTWYITGTGIT